MAAYTAKRFALACFILLWSAFISFAFISILPGDYFTRFKIAIAMAGLPVEETHAAMLEEHGLDRPWIAQFSSWIWAIVSKGDFGYALEAGNAVGQNHLTLSFLFRPDGEVMNSLLICGTSMVVAWLAAIPLGVLTATRRGKWAYVGLSVIGMPSLAMPGFVYAALVMWFLDVVVDPMMSRASLWGLYGWRYVGAPMSWAKFGSLLAHLTPIWIIVALPVFTVALRVLRGSMQDVLQEQYVVVARGKGLATGPVYLKHALRNALNPLISTIGITLPGVLVNALLVGFVFGIRTYGDLLRTAVRAQDPALLAFIMVFYSAVLVFGNFVADIGLAAADPRIRYD